MTARVRAGRRADVLLSDGTVASIRPVEDTDGLALKALHQGVAPENLRLRFSATSSAAGAAYVRHVLETPETLALVVERHGGLVALGTAEILDPGTAELALLVADDCHALGIGSLLVEHLAAAARDRGIGRFVAEVLVDNTAMLGVLVDAGFSASRRVEAGCVHVEMDTAASTEAIRAADERECRSEARSLRPVLAPRSVAVVGARRDATGVGAAVLRSILARGFTGAVHVVHPDAPDVCGNPTVRSLADIPGGVDLVVVAVPVASVRTVLEDAARAHARGAVVLTSGFAEMGGAGATLQRDLLEIARSNSMRLVGPNCLGLVNTDPAVSLYATFSSATPPAGGLALASQSGGVGIVVEDLACRLGLGIGRLVSLGNKVDVSGNDLLAAWRDDPHVAAAGLYLESFGNAPKFARMAREFSERKPLLAVVGGQSPGGRRAGASHTAAAATPAVGVRALFAQAGIIPCASAEELAECALLLSEQPRPHGRRVAILTNAGGMGVLTADAADAHGLSVPELPAQLRDAIALLTPGTGGTTNPVDAGAGAAPETIARIADLLLGGDHVDALVVLLVATDVGDSPGAVALLPGVRRRHPEKPVLLVPLGGLPLTSSGGVTAYPDANAAVRALARAAAYDEWRREPHVPDPPDDPDRAFRVRAVAQELLEASRADGWLAANESARLLVEHGLGAEGVVAVGPADSVAVAERIGYPVAVKAGGPSVVHRSERGLVRVGLTTADQVRQAVAAFEDELGAGTPILVQPVVAGVEVALGIVQDPCFGPLVMVGAGGVATEVWDDRVFLMSPVTRRDAARALRSLRVWPLLDGFRGAPRCDVGGLMDLLVRVSRLGEEVPAVAEMDLNPVIVTPSGCRRVDAKVRLAPARLMDAGIPRRLRDPS